MEICGDGLDEVLISLYQALLGSHDRNTGSRGQTRELLATALRIRRPRARLSRSEDRGHPFSALGELLWYLSASDDLAFIHPYVPEYAKDAVEGTIHGAYGPRLFSMRNGIDQFSNVARLLNKRSSSRRAVVQLFNAEDIADEYSEIPCTTTLQFHLRDNSLHMSATLRSNDAYWGLPHDVFCFTMLQEMMARRLGVELGEYYHYAGSMHIYEERVPQAERYVAEGYQRLVEMPPMPTGDPFQYVSKLLSLEKRIRNGEQLTASKEIETTYWADIILLLQAFWASGDSLELDRLKPQLSAPMYKVFLEARRTMKPKARGGGDKEREA